MTDKKLYLISFFMFLFIFSSLSFAGTVNYTYDAAGRLAEATYGSKIIKYTYDAAGNMLSRVIQAGLPDTVNPTGTGTDLTAIPQVNTPITLTINTAGTGTTSYRFYVGSNYGAPWTEVQPWSNDNSCTYTPTGEANHVFVAHISDNPSGGSYHQAGFSFATSGHSESGVVINSLTTNLSLPQTKGTPITLTAQAVGSGTIYYKFWYKDDDGWHIIKDWSEDKTATFTPNQAGTYTIVVRASTTADDSIPPHQPIAGLTCTVGD